MAHTKWNLPGICILWELRICAFWSMAWRVVVLLEVMNMRFADGSKFIAFDLIFFGLE
jgi:hypothetical protein